MTTIDSKLRIILEKKLSIGKNLPEHQLLRLFQERFPKLLITVCHRSEKIYYRLYDPERVPTEKQLNNMRRFASEQHAKYKGKA